MIAELNTLVDFVEEHLDDDIDATSLATALGTTEYHLRRMFSSLASMPLTDWFPSNPWRLRPGPSIVAVLDRADDFSNATCELWLPVERA